MTEIAVGDLFPIYSDFEANLKMYKKWRFMDIYIVDSRTLILARMRCPNIGQRMHLSLKYCYIIFKRVEGVLLKFEKNNKVMHKTS